MDDFDKKIIDILKQDSRTPFIKIAEKLKVSEGTIRHRVASLIKNKDIEKFTVVLRDKTNYIIAIRLDTKLRTANFVEKIRNIKNILSIYHITGEDSVMCNIESANIEELDNIVERIRKVNGVLNTRTITILKKY